MVRPDAAERCNHVGDFDADAVRHAVGALPADVVAVRIGAGRPRRERRARRLGPTRKCPSCAMPRPVTLSVHRGVPEEQQPAQQHADVAWWMPRSARRAACRRPDRLRVAVRPPELERAALETGADRNREEGGEPDAEDRRVASRAGRRRWRSRTSRTQHETGHRVRDGHGARPGQVVGRGSRRRRGVRIGVVGAGRERGWPVRRCRASCRRAARCRCRRSRHRRRGRRRRAQDHADGTAGDAAASAPARTPSDWSRSGGRGSRSLPAGTGRVRPVARDRPITTRAPRWPAGR